MSRDGSGNMSIPYPDFVNGTTADADQVDANNTDIVNALTNSIATDGQSVVTANIPMATFKFTGLGAGSAATDSANLGQIQAQAYLWGGTAGGTADALTLALSPAIAAYATNMRIGFKASANANTGAATVAVNGLAAKAIQINDAALSAGQIAANKYYELYYDGTAFQLTRLSGSPGDVSGPASSTDDAIATFDGTTGKIVQNSSWTIASNVLTAGGAVAMADNEVRRPKFIDYGEAINAIGGTGGGTQDIDITLGNVVTATVDTSANTFTFSNPSASGSACSFTLFLTNGGSQTVNWPASVDWPGGTAPTLTTAGVDILVFETLNGGTLWHGQLASQDSK